MLQKKNTHQTTLDAKHHQLPQPNKNGNAVSTYPAIQENEESFHEKKGGAVYKDCYEHSFWQCAYRAMHYSQLYIGTPLNVHTSSQHRGVCCFLSTSCNIMVQTNEMCFLFCGMSSHPPPHDDTQRGVNFRWLSPEVQVDERRSWVS